MKLNWLATYDDQRKVEMKERSKSFENNLNSVSSLSITADIANDHIGPLTTESQKLGSTVRDHDREPAKFNRFERLTNYDNLAKSVKIQKPGSGFDLMRSVTPKTKGLIYKGLSKDGEGRSDYLSKRRGKAPEEKYNLVISENCEYGWNQAVMRPQLKVPKFGKVPVVKMDFFRQSGIF